MPNRDGTGPKGQGPLTGRQQGKCKGSQPYPRKLRKCYFIICHVKH